LIALTGLLASAGLGFGLTIASVPFLLAAVLGAVPLVIGGFVGYRTIASHRTILSSAQLALEQILDRLEHRDLTRPDSLLSAFVPGNLLRR